MALKPSAAGRKVLIVEDEMVIVMMIEDALHDLGAEIVGPAAQLDAALRLADTAAIDAAVLDVNIRGENSYPVADRLVERGIPFVFSSGYGDWALERRHRDRPRLTKPFTLVELETQLLELLRLSPG